MPKYVGVASLTLVRRTNGEAAYVYAGLPVPDDIRADDAERFLTEGFIAEDPDNISGGMLNDDPSMTVLDAIEVTKTARTTKAAADKTA